MTVLSEMRGRGDTPDEWNESKTHPRRSPVAARLGARSALFQPELTVRSASGNKQRASQHARRERSTYRAVHSVA